MRNPWLWFGVLAALPWAAPGCGSSSGGGGSSSGTARLSQAEFLTEYADAICTGAAPCCQKGGLPFDDATCRTGVSTSMTATLTAAAAMEGVTFDADAAARCLSATQTLATSCDPSGDQKRSVSAICAAVLVGDHPVGAACQVDAQCAGAADKTARCNNTFDDITGAPGVVPPPPNTCIAVSSSSGPAFAKLGEPCSGTQGVYLEGPDGGIAFGAPVGGTSQGGGGSGGGSSVPQGALFCSLNDGGACDATSFTCVPPLVDGAACTTGSLSTFCSIASFCQNDVCVPLLDVGAACVGFQCKPELRCSQSRQVCIAPGETGAHCVAGDDCQSSDCRGGLCAPSLASGAATCDGGDVSGSVGGGNPVVGAGGSQTTPGGPGGGLTGGVGGVTGAGGMAGTGGVGG